MARFRIWAATVALLGTACADPYEPPASITVSVIKTGSGSGRVTVPSAGIDCGSVCSGSVPRGTLAVPFTQVADSGSQFGGWYTVSFFEESPPLPCGRATVCTLGGQEDISLWAEFDRIDTLRLTVAGPGSGSVEFIVTGEPRRTCTSACDIPIPLGADIVVIARADVGSRFEAWAGPVACNISCFVTMSGRTEVGVTWSLDAVASAERAPGR